ncbi:MAG TPA: glutamine amidotransferase [Polyangiaceae bacterium]
MSSGSLALAEGVGQAVVIGASGLVLVAFLLLGLELRGREGRHGWLWFTCALGVIAMLGAVLRPVRVTMRGTRVGPKVIVLVDQSRRLLLPAEGSTRRELALRALPELTKHLGDARLGVFGFGDGAPLPLAPSASGRAVLSEDSDLVAALDALSRDTGERPKAVVVVSDGRLSRPTSTLESAELERAVSGVGARIDTISLCDREPADASIRAVRTTGTAVAHQPFALTVEIGCSGGLVCTDIPVTVRELRHGVEPFVLATGVAKMTGNDATVELSVTLERAGSRIVEISIESPKGDQIPENNVRLIPFSVARDRLRLLHVAGRPTYDVRALRRWLKADESIDLIAFFILRTEEDNTETSDDSELALIPFPVDELFTDHLPSFDAVILQDIDAVTYKLARHLGALENYVRSGGGLIMVGGPSAFAGGGYAGSPIERVLPVSLRRHDPPFDGGEFVPRYTEAGRSAPVLRGLVALVGDELPTMGGANLLGPARDGALVLWEHPEQRIGAGPMPVLALGEAGDGRSIALGVDGTHALAFSEFAESSGGRAYGALWDGLVGWLMRDPRYEAAHMELVGPCIAGLPAKLRIVRIPDMQGEIELEIERLGLPVVRPPEQQRIAPANPGPVEVELGPLEAGGYSARARIGSAPPTRFDFACERGGQAWSDSRPDPERLQRIARATGGSAVGVKDISDLPVPPATEVASERQTSPLLPVWLWTLLAAGSWGAHWYLRRRSGLV